MRIGIDVSQLAYLNTGVANYLFHWIHALLDEDKNNSYIFFGSSLRNRDFLRKAFDLSKHQKKFRYKFFPFPPSFLELLWNKLHVLPIEMLIGDVDIFITSDWTEPPTKKAKKATILYDLIVYKYPKETAGKIVAVQKRKLAWVKKESSVIFCISEATKKDAIEILGIEESRLQVIGPGI